VEAAGGPHAAQDSFGFRHSREQLLSRKMEQQK
jgi:hypothetical protein